MDYSSFIGQYSLSKTLRFKLIPQGQTIHFFDKNKMLDADKKRAVYYSRIKELIDSRHKEFIEYVLEKFSFTEKDLSEYKNYFDSNDVEKLKETAKNMRKSVSECFKKTNKMEYEKLTGKEVIVDILPGLVTGEEDKEAVDYFQKFTTYFTGYHISRKNLYNNEGKTSEIAFRIVDQNLPKFLDNLRSWNIIERTLPSRILEQLNTDMSESTGMTANDLFALSSFNFVLSQCGIDKYNNWIGGYTKEDGTKIQGLNEHINLFNQQGNNKLPKIKPLFKQILSDRVQTSFIPEKFNTDRELLDAVNIYKQSLDNPLESLVNLIRNIRSYDLDHIYITAGSTVHDISTKVYGSWSLLNQGIDAVYEASHPYPVNPTKQKRYQQDKERYYRNKKSYSVSELEESGKSIVADSKLLSFEIIEWNDTLSAKIKDTYHSASLLLTQEYPESHNLSKDDDNIKILKGYLDSLKEYQRFVSMFAGSGDEPDKDTAFYGEFSEAFLALALLNRLYDKVRNHITKKPYSIEKIKLNFNNPQFLGGWDQNKVSDYSCAMLVKDGLYYLAVMSNDRRIFSGIPQSASVDCYKKLIYKLLPGPNKMLPKVFFSKKGLETFQPSEKILKIYNEGSFKNGTNFSLSDCHALIDFYKESIQTHPDWSKFEFIFSPTESYGNISEFYRQIHDQGYTIRYEDIPVSYIEEKTGAGELYLFRIYNKDFSSYSHGNPNLHTLYFKLLFDPRNLADVVLKMNGESEMFYRPKSIDLSETETHPANKEIGNKNPSNKKKQSKFPYDMIKNKRYTESQFELHLPVTINFKASDPDRHLMNNAVCRELTESGGIYAIGIDRGERNLLYLCVVDGEGKIVEQYSLNEIINEYNGVEYKTDYHALLGAKEENRLKERREWKTIENIKDLKEGYISQAVHKICRLAVKYNAVIIMENLNSGFKNSRSKVEKSVYQKFEKMLVEKLSYLTDKTRDPEEPGGVLRGYQLACPVTSFDDMRGQNGIIFYIPAWLTSKIDPATGFADLLRPRYTSIEASKEFIGRFQKISYNAESDMFELVFDYSDFPGCNIDHNKNWTVCTNGVRIEQFRNADKNNQWDSCEIILTEAFIDLFHKYGIDYRAADLICIFTKQNDKAFFTRLLKLISLTLQIRNTGRDTDYLISPVRGSDGIFYDSRNKNSSLPCGADANGAYNIARKGLWVVDQIKKADDYNKINFNISNKQWLQYAQTHN